MKSKLLAGLFLLAGVGIGWFLGEGQKASPRIEPVQVKKVEAKPAAKSRVESLSIPALNEWTDRYADGKEGDVRFFNLTRLMKDYKLTRLEAVEVQNTYRDLTRAENGTRGDAVLQKAIDLVKAG